MTLLAQRQQLITLIDQATNAGARLHIACSEVNISKRTYRRWKADKNHLGDKRPIAVRPAPSNKLSDINHQRRLLQQSLAKCFVGISLIYQVRYGDSFIICIPHSQHF